VRGPVTAEQSYAVRVSLSEAFHESALAALGHPLHI
jgi:hypothetical protein